ncbi:xanthine dehydrogenase molybdopterin binding subunit [Kaistia algarum]|uniref:xanthine dehydrogenase molybdopterin binding subunit n=1 Tax=Kaistia algarum TaxID=2083279 RepID=UPI000CE7E0BA|nr:xanthine dehydrogenase molybdopterin binding subunit [Kaistia algarum]MCX5514825.1 xanthine dehydrogenase molybdopterin binding subunit [Kaistia algarum]PPE79584.1 xanthine dehydrogenase molybdopterin binding subunit [Kaistia algarum]
MPPSDVLIPDSELAVVRKPLPHDSAPRHVTGAAAYIDDIREPAGTLHVAPGYAPIAAGRLLDVDLSAVSASPGVVAVMTAADLPGANDISPKLIGDDPALADGEIRFHGQVVFIVIAETRDQARRAAKKAKFATEAAKPVIDVDEASDTVLPDYAFLRGDPDAAIAGAPVKFSDSFRIGGQEHFYLEGQVSMAVPGEAGEIFVYASTQHPSEVQHVVAHALHLPTSAVTVEIRRMGGGFGGKESQATQWAVLAAVAAWKTGVPCKMRLDRDDDMIMTGKRHDFRVDYSVGHDEDGVLTAVDVAFAARCGHSEDLSMGVVDRTMFHADNSYFYPECRVLTRRYRTNTCSNTAFRGFGGPQGMVFAERMMDQIAYRLGKDPLDVRKANFYAAGRDRTPYGQQVTDNLLPELVAELEAKSDYRARREEIAAWNAESRILKRGLALTPIKFGISFTLMPLNQAGALVHLYRDGSLHLNHGGTEMGQGLFLKVAQVVAEEFGVDLGKVAITATRTDKVPNTSPTAASAGTDLNAMAAVDACGQIKERLYAFIEQKWQIRRHQVRFRDNQVFFGNRAMSLGELANAAYLERVSLSAAGHYKTPVISWNRDKAEGRPFFYFAYGASCSEVTIDTMTGEMKVDRIDVLHDVGKSLNPAIDIGQIEGGFVQGMGWLTTEELVWDSQGRLRTHAPSTYKIPAASDIPEHFRVELFQSDGAREKTIYRSKAVGEPPLMLPISVWCAIANAIASLRPGGVPKLNAPATPEAILKSVRAMVAGD